MPNICLKVPINIITVLLFMLHAVMVLNEYQIILTLRQMCPVQVLRVVLIQIRTRDQHMTKIDKIGMEH